MQKKKKYRADASLELRFSWSYPLMSVFPLTEDEYVWFWFGSSREVSFAICVKYEDTLDEEPQYQAGK